MQVFALVGRLLARAATIVVLLWWFGSVGVRLIVRSREDGWPLSTGRRWHCGAFLFLTWLVVSFALALVIVLIVRVAKPDLTEEDLKLLGLGPLWEASWNGLMRLLGLIGIFAAGSEALSAWAAYNRGRFLTHGLSDDGGWPIPPADHPPAANGGRRIVILCDGTSNSPDQMEDGAPATTNVWKLFRKLELHEGQVTWYQAGVGTDTSTTAQRVRVTKKLLAGVGADTGARAASFGSKMLKLMEAISGAGISDAISRGYTEIVRQYRPGDRIYLVGFSRGAYAARCIAGVISTCGLLRSENLRYSPDVVRLYRSRSKTPGRTMMRGEVIHVGASIEFLGVFDTVASLGAPLWGWWFRLLPIWRNRFFDTDPAPSCRYVYHALSMDERRSQFFPTMFTEPAAQKRGHLQRIEQRWFRGAHGDIGGGYANTALSDIALGWMMGAMEKHDLTFQPDARSELRPNPLGRLHDELERRPYWKLFGSWPRWHPGPAANSDPGGSELHHTVHTRAAFVQKTLGRQDLRSIAPGEKVDFRVEARRDWDRTGLLIEKDALYRLTYREGEWRDADKSPATPSGQTPKGLDLRYLLGWNRRLRSEHWVTLVGTVAHPRAWPPNERGLLTLLRLLFVSLPVELRGQLAPFGRDLGARGSQIFLRSRMPDGLLHIFANDWWQAADNNSGSIGLTLERLPEDTKTDRPYWQLDEKGWTRDDAHEPPRGWGWSIHGRRRDDG